MADYHDSLEKTQRQVKVAEFMRRRITQADMARMLGVNSSTITRDVQDLQERWAEELAGKIPGLRAREVKRLDHLEMVAQMNMENAMKRRAAIEEAEQQARGRPKTKEWEVHDRAVARWLDESLSIIRQRAKLLGLNADPPPQASGAQVNVPISFIMTQREGETPLVIEGGSHAAE